MNSDKNIVADLWIFSNKTYMKYRDEFKDLEFVSWLNSFKHETLVIYS